MKILVLRFSSIGDIVLTSSVVRCLNEQVKDAEVQFLTKKSFRSLVEHNPHVRKVWTFEKNINEVLPDLKAEKFDHIVDLHKNLRSFQVKRALFRPTSTFSKLNIRKWLLVRFKLQLMPDRHIVDRYFEAVKALGVQNDGQPNDFFFEQEPVHVLANHGLISKQYTAVSMGAKFATKTMPVALMAEVLKGHPETLVLLGGPADNTRAKELINLLPGQHVINLCGNTSLLESAFIVKEAKVLLSHDTGLMHIAACFQTQIVSVWGNTVPELGMTPYRPLANTDVLFEVKGLSCRPCSKIGFAACPKGHFDCMQNQNAQGIKKVLEQS